MNERYITLPCIPALTYYDLLDLMSRYDCGLEVSCQEDKVEGITT